MKIISLLYFVIEVSLLSAFRVYNMSSLNLPSDFNFNELKNSITSVA